MLRRPNDGTVGGGAMTWPALLLFLAVLAVPQDTRAAAARCRLDDGGSVSDRWDDADPAGPTAPPFDSGADAAGLSDPVSAPECAFENAWRTASAFWSRAHLEKDDGRKRSLAEEAMRWADRARHLAPQRVEGHFFFALSIGEYGSSLGVVEAVWRGAASKFEDAISAAYAIDRDFQHGAPMIALGRYYYVLPWPLRDLDESRRYLEEARARHPRALVARVCLAETYLALGRADEARRELEFVIASEAPAAREQTLVDPEAMARALLTRWFGTGWTEAGTQISQR